MKLTDTMKTLEGIEEMSLDQKQKAILEIQKKNFQYQEMKIVEIVKDKWVFLQNDSETDIVDIDYIILEWAQAEELRMEMEQAERGDTVVDKYFKKYGTLSEKDKLKDGALHSQTVYFGGKACPGDTWNTELFMYRLGVYKSNDNYDNTSSVKIYADMNVEDLMDAKMKGNEPTLRHCHDWYTSPHKKAINHYKHEDWLQDIETAKNLFANEVDRLTKGCETLEYSSKKNLYCVPEKYVFWFDGKADHNGDDTEFVRSNLDSSGKYRDSNSKNSKVPARFDKTVGKGELMEMAMKYCEDKFSIHNFRQEFKY